MIAKIAPAPMIATLAMMLSLFGCGAATQSGPQGQSGRVTLVIVNQGIDKLTIKANGQRVGWVMPGTRTALVLPSTLTDRHLDVEALIQNGFDGFRSSFVGRAGECWEWTIQLQHSAANPHAAPCWGER